MADIKKAYADNVSGQFFVDSTCINCDTCRQLAPAVFADQGAHSYVFAQPVDAGATRAATRALICCPTGSIGTIAANQAKTVMKDLPLLIEDNVYYSGFNSPKSYGGNSFFIQHAEGNWLVDSPKYLPHLVKRFRDLGGIRYIFLTHQDDVAEADRYATEFGAMRIIHRADLNSQPKSELVIDGDDTIEFAAEFQIIPVPGHTRGHMVLLYKSKYLFTGDHLCYDRDEKDLYAFRTHCWYSFEEQTRSMAKLLDYNFEWVLAGHGDRIKLPADQMQTRLKALIERMQKS
ncbi:MAG: fold metallo-hydrolase [Cyanobacteriota bacterium erpe_2018_sw_39hr_WHONDRS-SW48-000098_B_bin.30]|nr:fold metallo-hydrolase [Cyanobacteriota bacterium erpe_2018_sw_39hr_WHONDRS-SW48-000098_B_bin.30]